MNLKSYIEITQKRQHHKPSGQVLVLHRNAWKKHSLSEAYCKYFICKTF